MRRLLIFSFSLIAFSAHAAESERAITVFAASSLTNVLPDLTRAWAEKINSPLPRLSFGPSAIMARQVIAGAPADIIISAHPDWITFLKEQQQLTGKAVIVAENRLILVQPGSGLMVNIPLTRELLIKTIGRGRLAIADPSIAPAGVYARSYLRHLQLWERFQHRIAMGSSVRQTLLLVERGGMTGFVYATDARLSSSVDIVGVVPTDKAPQILYAAGRTKRKGADADKLYAFLTSDVAAAIWRRHGFFNPTQSETLNTVSKQNIAVSN
ncbi:molybdate ABC transporter substrate-binding protein [Kordiimonas sp.]|uniref:molybdate ABC transporter substrate-binding protein n=1 Tax=Kordiimonas sp. TaxID=1970157 RepID=UPI003A954EA1